MHVMIYRKSGQLCRLAFCTNYHQGKRFANLAPCTLPEFHQHSFGKKGLWKTRIWQRGVHQTINLWQESTWKEGVQAARAYVRSEKLKKEKYFGHNVLPEIVDPTCDNWLLTLHNFGLLILSHADSCSQDMSITLLPYKGRLSEYNKGNRERIHLCEWLTLRKSDRTIVYKIHVHSHKSCVYGPV